MKQTKISKNKIVLGILFFMLTIGLTSMKSVTKIDPSGTWDYEVEMAEGTMSDEFTISKDGDKYEVSIETTQFGTLELNNIELKGNDLSADVDMQGATIEFKFEFDGDSMKGTVSTPDGELEMTAKRRK